MCWDGVERDGGEPAQFGAHWTHGKMWIGGEEYFKLFSQFPLLLFGLWRSLYWFNLHFQDLRHTRGMTWAAGQFWGWPGNKQGFEAVALTPRMTEILAKSCEIVRLWDENDLLVDFAERSHIGIKGSPGGAHEQNPVLGFQSPQELGQEPGQALEVHLQHVETGEGKSC